MSGVEDASLAKVPHQRLRDEDEDERGDGGVRGFSAEEEAVIREDMDLTEGFVEAVMPLSLSQGDKTRRTRRRKVCIAIVISTSCLLGLLLLAAALYIFVWPLHGNDTTPTGLCVS